MANVEDPKDNERAQTTADHPARPAAAAQPTARPSNAARPAAPNQGDAASQPKRPAEGSRQPGARPDAARRPNTPAPGQSQPRRPEGPAPADGKPQGPVQGPARRPEPGRPAGGPGQAQTRRPEGAPSPDRNGTRGPGQPNRAGAPPSNRPGGAGPNSGSGPNRGPGGSGQSSGGGQSGGQNNYRGPSGPGQNSGGQSGGQGGGQGGYRGPGGPGGNRGPGGGGPGGGSSGGGGGTSRSYPTRGNAPRGNASRGPNRRPGGKGRPNHGGQSREALEAPRPTTQPAAPKPSDVTEIVIPAQLTVRELAEKMHKSPIDVIKVLMNYGIMVPITQTIDFDTAVVVGEDLGITVKGEAAPEPEVKEEEPEAPRTLRQRIMAGEDPNALELRPPVVTVLGHVDHGKTTLLDAIRETRVVEGEAGGITQHIGAYQVERNDRKITFLDTPGHAAFTAMRARGASVTDIAVLVVAADDGVMPQTKEAIAHARAAQVPIVVALNKIDKPGANADRVKQELADNDVLVEEYGGDVVCVPVSAKMRRGIEDLLESILLVYDVEPSKANPHGECVGSVIESRLDERRGPTATLLVQNGTLRQGDSIVLGNTYGKVRAMFDDKGQPLNEAPPAMPVVVLGLSEVPVAGDTFRVVPDERTARGIAEERQLQHKAEANQPAPKAMTLESIFAQVEAGQAKELNLILKADVQGSIEPIANSLEKLSNDKVKVNILQKGTGNISESDVMLAVASKAIILGFSVTVDGTAQRMADAEGVDIRLYNIIYKLVEDLEKALAGMLEPVFKEVVTGHAEIRQVFRVSKVGKVAGCMIIDGEVARGSMVRVKRGGEVIHEDRISGLKRFQEDVPEVKTGYECGINLANFTDFEVGDVVEAYKKERVS